MRNYFQLFCLFGIGDVALPVKKRHQMSDISGQTELLGSPRILQTSHLSSRLISTDQQKQAWRARVSVVDCFVAFRAKFPLVASGLASPVNIRAVLQRVALGDGPGPPD